MSDLHFDVVGARPDPHAAVPTLLLRLRIRDAAGAPIHAIALRVQVWIQATRRHYQPAEEDRLLELFGEPTRWGETLRGLLWRHASAMVPAFEGEIEIDLPIECSYDFEVASAKYLHALDGGEIPLLLLFSGTVFAQGPAGMAVDQVRWDREAEVGLPVATWRSVVDAFWPGAAWLRLRRDAFDALHRYRGEHALTSWEDTVDLLLRRAAAAEGEPA